MCAPFLTWSRRRHQVIRSTEAPPSSLFRLLDIFRSFYPELVMPSGVAKTGGAGGLGKALDEWRDKVKATLSEGEGEMDAAAVTGRSVSVTGGLFLSIG